MRDGIYLQVESASEFVITADNSGGIGLKEQDFVQVPNEIVGYFSARVALMENLSLGGAPQAIILQNFSGDVVWEEYRKGIDRTLRELDLPSLPLLGSSESNFNLVQSALGLTIIGKRNEKLKNNNTTEAADFAVLGTPLVGLDVITNQDQVLPLPLFNSLLSHEGIYEIVPVGSKGIQVEWDMLCQRNNLPWTNLETADGISLTQSSGPATCVLISYDPTQLNSIYNKTSRYFHPLTKS
ncbi:ATPase [Bacillus sp. AK128]